MLDSFEYAYSLDKLSELPVFNIIHFAPVFSTSRLNNISSAGLYVFVKKPDNYNDRV